MVLQLNKKYNFFENIIGKEKTKSNVAISLKDNILNFNYEIFDENIFSPYKEDNDDLYNHDAVEVFISFDGKRDEYYEYELSPSGKRFFGLIKNPTLSAPKLTKIKPSFNQSVVITKNGYNASLRIKMPEGVDVNNILLNCFYIDSNGNDCKFYSINPTKNKSFHLGSYLMNINN